MKPSSITNHAPRIGPNTSSNRKNMLLKKKLKKEDSSSSNGTQRRSSVQEKEKDKFSSTQKLSKSQSSKSTDKSNNGDLKFIFGTGDSDAYSSKPYHSDGDPTMYTAEAVREREQLKNDVEVKKQVYNFMNHYKFDENGQLSKNEYLHMHLQLASLLRDDLKSDYKEGELRFILEQDWKHDSKGKDKMSRDDLFQSLFELVDIWTPSTKKQEYLDFFTLVAERLAPNSNDFFPTQNQLNNSQIKDDIQKAYEVM